MSKFLRRIQKTSPSATGQHTGPGTQNQRLDGTAMPPAGLRKLVELLRQTREDECLCGEVFEALDQYSELTLQGVEVADLMPLVQHHLEMCPDCREEYELLLSILRAQSS